MFGMWMTTAENLRLKFYLTLSDVYGYYCGYEGYSGVKVSWKTRRNAVSGPGYLSFKRSGCKIIRFHSRNVRS